jgi:hypothetical protein
MIPVADSDKDFLSMLGTFAVIIITSFVIIIGTNAIRKDEGTTAQASEVAGNTPCTQGTTC